MIGLLHIDQEVGAFTLELETSIRPYVLRMNFERDLEEDIRAQRYLTYCGNILLALIDNVDVI